MIMTKKIKFFLILVVILFSLIGTTGCETDNLGNPDHKTGPDSNPVKQFCYTEYVSYEKFIKDLNLNNYSIVSFDFDNISDVGEKEYYYETFIDYFEAKGSSLYHYFQYTFYSNNDPINQNVDKVHYKIKCYDISLIKDYDGSNFSFKLISEENRNLIYYLLLNDECVMKIDIDFSENYTYSNIDDIIKLLENNIMVINCE